MNKIWTFCKTNKLFVICNILGLCIGLPLFIITFRYISKPLDYVENVFSFIVIFLNAIVWTLYGKQKVTAFYIDYFANAILGVISLLEGFLVNAIFYLGYCTIMNTIIIVMWLKKQKEGVVHDFKNKWTYLFLGIPVTIFAVAFGIGEFYLWNYEHLSIYSCLLDGMATFIFAIVFLSDAFKNKYSPLLTLIAYILLLAMWTSRSITSDTKDMLNGLKQVVIYSISFALCVDAFIKWRRSTTKNYSI